MANRLISEQSPYLLQHAHNPVDWYPWCDEAFEKAKTENKPVLVSIGYAACHWCHVMEHESFEDEATARYMNEHFVCIKVDREEHPDVDHMYMDAVQAISGSGGWPLNAFVTPDRVPFYGGTYYPPRPAYSRPSWIQVLQRMAQIWAEQNDEVQRQAEQMVNHLRQSSMRMFGKANAGWDVELCRKIAANLLNHADKEKGGFGAAPKFPGTMAISYLLEYHRFTGHEDALAHGLRSLDAMADGGIYDQLGGGFARYSTDREWLAPHFEKMLYDNALLVGAYCDAFTLTRNERYKTIIEETIAFAERELKSPEGGYYCALDADSEGIEGKFYTWTWNEWLHDLGGDEPVAATYFGITAAGNWEHTNILHVACSTAETAHVHACTEADVMAIVDRVKATLLAVRNNRIRPITDDKCLLSWNALMNIALCKAATALQSDDYRDRAAQHMTWMLQQFGSNDQLKHTSKNGIAKIPAKLDDYAYLIQAMLQLASLSGDEALVLKAVDLLEVTLRDFVHEEGFFYYTPVGQADIPVRKVDLYDGATPSANAVMAHNLWLCGMCMERTGWIDMSVKMLRDMTGNAANHGYSFAYWAQLIQRNIVGMKTAVCTGVGAQPLATELKTNYLPNAFILFSDNQHTVLPIMANKFSQDKKYIFVCSEEACLPPVSSVEQGVGLIAKIIM